MPNIQPLRPRFIAEARSFVYAACVLPGVVRIALIGSLTTSKPNPKDVDMLVTISDDMDLEPLATLGRKLNGHLQHFTRGGEVFLANVQGDYLGRTCPWKMCAPGVRMRCDALNCGQRPFLHDDLAAIQLDRALIAAPPLELWPNVVIRTTLPADLLHGLVEPLRRERE